MSPQNKWVFNPDVGGIKIPDPVKHDVEICRLRYFGDDRWGFAFYKYSNEKYELSMYPDGEFFGKPEDAFLASAMYLQ